MKHLLRSLIFSALAALSLSAAPALWANTVSPGTVTVTENASQQFTATVASTWTTSCGTISATGLFHAPLSPTTCTITATATNGSGAGTGKATVNSPITITPAGPSTAQGNTQQFTATAPVVWWAKCGTITSTGLYTASGTVGTYCTVRATAASGTQYTAFAYDHIVAAPAAAAVSPANPTVAANATQQFTQTFTGSPVWTASCGTISTGGLFKAPATAGSCTITASGSGQTASTVATIKTSTTLTMSPTAAQTAQGGTQQFTASLPVVWWAKCGTIDANGLYTASGTVGTYCTVRANTISGPAQVVYGYDKILAPPAATIVTVAPLNPVLTEGATQQFTANTAVNWAASCGSISSSGLYTAPLAAGSCTVTATSSTSTAVAASTAATVTPPFSVSPSSVNTGAGQTQQFTAGMAVLWSSSCGSIGATTGLYTAPATTGVTCTITATASSGPAYTATASALTGAALPFSISPTTAAVSEGASQSFAATAGATWSSSCGSVDATGNFTAPLVAGPCVVTATAADGSGQTATATANVSSPITISPASASSAALGKQTFSANQSVNWSASCGTIDTSTGIYIAPPGTSTCTVTATASGGTPYTATASVNVDVINYPTWLGDSQRTGARNQESVLNANNVQNQLGVQWTANLDGYVWAQPLYLNALTVNGAPHNVVYVGTDNDTMYALDGDTGAQLWQRSFLANGETAVTGSTIQSYIPQIGILGTPAIDPDSGTLYVVTFTVDSTGTNFIHRLHSIDVATGQDKFGGSAVISDANFTDPRHNNRSALVIANGQVYVSFAGVGDHTPWHGFVFAYDEVTLAETAVFDATPGGFGGGIWMSTAGPAVDASGNIYVSTGNGSWDGTSSFGTSALKLSPSLRVLDYFTPYNQAALSTADLDLSSGGVLVVPDQNGSHSHLAIVCGKSSPIYVLDRDQMGQYNSGGDQILQRLDNQLGGTTIPNNRDAGQACYSSPAIWGQNVYFVANGDVMKRFTLDGNTGQLSGSPVAQGTFAYGWPGAQPVITSNGGSSGIVWTVDNKNGTLRANDATTLNQLYVSGRLGYTNKWVAPTVVNGHIYIGLQGKIVALGLP